MSSISQLNSDLKFGLGGTSYIYCNSGSTGALSIIDYNTTTNPNVYLTIDSLTNKTIIPSPVQLNATNVVINTLTVTNFTGSNYYFTGPTGALGPQGTQGFRGFQGIIGSQGLQGNISLQGLQGSQGLQGPQGPQGFQNPLRGLQGTSDITQPVLNRGNDRVLSSISAATGLNAEANLTFNNNTLFVNNNVSITGLYIQSITGLSSTTGTIDTNFSINLSHSSLSRYTIIDLTASSVNNGRETTLLNYNPSTPILYDINTTSGTTYSTGTTNYSTSFLFYSGKWYISGKY